MECCIRRGMIRWGVVRPGGGDIMKTVYVCSDTVTGIFSGIYDAWKAQKGEEECTIAFRGMIEAELFCDYVEVEETQHKAQAVETLIQRHLGKQAYWDIYHAVLADDLKKGEAVLGTMLAAKAIPDSKKIMDHLSCPKVGKVFELSRKVGGEAHLFKGFVRFRELTNDVLYAEIEPRSQVLTCIAPHFANRLPLENWMIYDKSHHMFVVHEAGKRWVLVSDEYADISGKLEVTEKEKEYERLWRGFVKSISIESRENPRCQRSHLPLQYRPNMTEFILDD